MNHPQLNQMMNRMNTNAGVNVVNSGNVSQINVQNLNNQGQLVQSVNPPTQVAMMQNAGQINANGNILISPFMILDYR